MAEYERELARQWARRNGAERQVQLLERPGKLLPRLNFIPDNDARVAWRKHELPTERFVLPGDFAPSEARLGSRSRSRRPARTESPNLAVPEVADIATDTGTEIQLAPQVGVRSRGIEVLIWGEPDAAKQAITQLELWIEAYRQDAKPDPISWAKVQNITEDRRPKFEAKIRKQEEAQRFKRDPEKDGARIAAAGTFEWGSGFHMPQDILGHSLEACDEIRSQHRCWIKLDVSSNSIKVTGQDRESVKKALARVRGCYYQAVARVRGSEVQRRQVLCGTTDVPTTTKAELIPCYEQNQQGHHDDEPERMMGKKPSLPDFDFPKQRMRFSSVDIETVETAIRRLCGTLSYCRANLQMQAWLGTFVLAKYRENVRTLGDLIALLEDENIEGGVYSSGKGWQLKTLLERLSRSGLTTVPGDATSERPDELYISPTVSATFLLGRPHGSDGLLFFKLDVKWTYSSSSKQWDCITKAWSRLGFDPFRTDKMLDICLIDLDTGATAWDLEIKTFDIVSERSGKLDAFADSVKLDSSDATLTDNKKLFVKYTAQQGLLLQSIMQKKTWGFEHGHSGYVCDVTQRTHFVLRNARTALPNQYSLMARDTRIDLTVGSPRWDVALAENGIIGAGQCLSADFDMNRLFPKEFGGVKGFLEILNDFWSIILGV